jgi:hypothetical protein
MNTNRVVTTDWSNPESKSRYLNQWNENPELFQQYLEGKQCGGCTYFAPFNADWGLCCNAAAQNHCETVFEHFTCERFVHEGWGPHSFTEDVEFHCRCGGESITD